LVLNRADNRSMGCTDQALRSPDGVNSRTAGSASLAGWVLSLGAGSLSTL